MSDQVWKKLKGDFSNLEYSWITAPPVQIIPSDDLLKIIAKLMISSIQSYDTGGYDTSDGEGGIRKDVDDWNDRVADSVSILQSLINTSGGDYNVIYNVIGVTAGLICVTDHDPPKVDWLVSHPGVDGCGGTMIELACDWSDQKNHGGKLCLMAAGVKATRAYLAMGFTKDDGDTSTGGYMSLDPNGNPKWAKVGGQWKLAKLAAKGYYSVRLATS